ncbi:MAG: sigma-70 family RNA polymerase sigma factor [Gaiellaceae bacterium]
MSAVAALRPQPRAETPEAYAEDLYKRYHGAVFRLCQSQLRRREDADDAVQTTFIYALLSLRRGVVPQLELPWLITIAKNACSTRRRSGMRRGEYETTHDLDSLQDRLAAPERADVASGEDFRDALSDVPENQRKALLLREWRGLSYSEIGTELGLSQAATEALLFRARQSVAQRLSQRMGAPMLNGASLLAFVRNRFQTTVAKSVAVGTGAALTVTALPAAQPQPAPARNVPAAPPVTHVQQQSAQQPTTSSRTNGESQSPAAARTPVRRLTPRGIAVRPTSSAGSTTAQAPSVREVPAATQAPRSEPAPAPASDVSETISIAGAGVELPPVPVSVDIAVPQLPLPAPVQDIADAAGEHAQVTKPAVSIKLP